MKENQGVIFVEEKLHYIKFNPIENSLVGKKTFGNLTEINGWIAQGPRARRFLTGLLLGSSGAAKLSNKLFEHCCFMVIPDCPWLPLPHYQKRQISDRNGSDIQTTRMIWVALGTKQFVFTYIFFVARLPGAVKLPNITQHLVWTSLFHQCPFLSVVIPAGTHHEIKNRTYTLLCSLWIQKPDNSLRKYILPWTLLWSNHSYCLDPNIALFSNRVIFYGNEFWYDTAYFVERSWTF